MIRNNILFSFRIPFFSNEKNTSRSLQENPVASLYAEASMNTQAPNKRRQKEIINPIYAITIIFILISPVPSFPFSNASSWLKYHWYLGHSCIFLLYFPVFIISSANTSLSESAFQHFCLWISLFLSSSFQTRENKKKKHRKTQRLPVT